MSKRSEQTKRLALTGVMLALAAILSFLRVFEAPFGGSITACSMLPVMVVAYTYGVKWGLLTGAVHGVMQALLGAAVSSAFAGQNIIGVVLILLIDYLLAFSALGLAGVFKGRIKNHTVAFSFGIALAGVIRLLWHILSGCVLYGQWARSFFEETFVNSFSQKLLANGSARVIIVVYSTLYNAAYMVPETVITILAGALLLSFVKPVRREMTAEHG